MVRIPEVPPAIEAGRIPSQVHATCKFCGVEASALMGWVVKNDAVVLLLPSGQKVTFPIVGQWINLPFSWALDDSPSAAGERSAFDHMPAVGAFDPPVSGVLPIVAEPAPPAPRARRGKK